MLNIDFSYGLPVDAVSGFSYYDFSATFYRFDGRLLSRGLDAIKLVLSFDFDVLLRAVPDS